MQDFLRHNIPDKWLHRIRTRRHDLFRRMADARQQHAEEIRDILARYPDRPVLVYLPTVDWSFLRQRPQQLALALARAGCLFFYLSPCNRADAEIGFREEAERLYVGRIDYRLFELFPNPVVWVSWTVNRRFLPYFGPHRLVYDILDELEVFDGYGPAMEKDHRRLLQEADAVFAVSEKLLDQIRPMRQDARLSRNAADYDHFACPPADEAPEDLAPLLDGTRVIGYVGALARWIDYGRIRAVARHDRDWRIVLIGPDYDGTLDPSGLLSEPNVCWLGPKDYDALPAYVLRFDVALVPFRADLDLVQSVSPIKLYEYAAAGVPVVSTDMRECRDLPEVAVAADEAAFVAAVARDHDAAHGERLRAFGRENSWDARAREILAALGLGESGGETRP